MAYDYSRGMRLQQAPDGSYFVSTVDGNYTNLNQQAVAETVNRLDAADRAVYARLQAQFANPNEEFQRFLAKYPNKKKLDTTGLEFDEWRNTYNEVSGRGDINKLLGSQALKKSGLFDQYTAQTKKGLEQEAERMRNSQSKWYRKAVKTAVPIAIGTIGAALGGAAIAPSAFASAVGGGTALSGTAPSSSALLAAPSGLGSGAGFAASTGSALSPGALGLASSGGMLPSVGASSLGVGSFATKSALTGALKGGIGGYMSGGDMSSALKGAALGGVTGGYGDAIASGVGLTGAGASAFSGALQGASGGLANGDMKTAALGAAMGGASGYVNAGGNVPGLGSKAETINWNQGGSSVLNPGSGALGKVSTIGGGNSMFGSKLGEALKIGGSIYSQGQTEDANEEIRRRLQQAQGRAQGMLQPYQQAGQNATSQLSSALSGGFQPGDLTQDPGYQFQLQQGEQALGRRMAAQGMNNSGAALKAAQEYGQGLAGTTYNDAYNRWLQQNQQLAGLSGQGYNAAGNLAGLEINRGDIDGTIMSANQENKNRVLASILSGVGSFF